MSRPLITLVNDTVWGDKLEQRGRAGRIAATLLRMIYGVGRDMLSGQLAMHAMSLVYTTLLTVVPLIAFSFSVLKGFGVHKSILEPALYRFMAPLGPKGVEYTDNLIRLVDNVNGSVLGGLSLAFFIYTAISMVQKIETSFNFVWYVERPRSLTRRFTEYFSVLLIGPVFMVVALGLIASIERNVVIQKLMTIEPAGTLLVSAGQLLPYLIIVSVFTFLYKLIPNTKVNFSAALVGGLIAGTVWAGVGELFTSIVVYSSTRLAIYSGFAIPISALIWLYVSWLILLLGAQIAFYYQHPAFLRLGRLEPQMSNRFREQLAINVMYLAASSFRHGDKNCTIDTISSQLNLAQVSVNPVIESLESAGLLLVTEYEQLIPGREIGTISLTAVLDAVRGSGGSDIFGKPVWSGPILELATEMETAIRGFTAERSLRDLLDSAEADADRET